MVSRCQCGGEIIHEGDIEVFELLSEALCIYKWLAYLA